MGAAARDGRVPGLVRRRIDPAGALRRPEAGIIRQPRRAAPAFRDGPGHASPDREAGYPLGPRRAAARACGPAAATTLYGAERAHHPRGGRRVLYRIGCCRGEVAGTPRAVRQRPVLLGNGSAPGAATSAWWR